MSTKSSYKIPTRKRKKILKKLNKLMKPRGHGTPHSRGLSSTSAPTSTPTVYVPPFPLAGGF